MELISKNIFKKASELVDLKYQEIEMTHPLSKCDSILINHSNKTYQYTKK